LWGIDTLGALASLPEKPLISRIGQDGQRLQHLARGTLPHLFVPIEPPSNLDEYIELDSPVELLEPLLFVLGSMLGQLMIRAANRALALATATITLLLEGGGSHTRTVRPALPSNDKQLWIKLFHLELDARPPGAAVLALRLTAEPGQTGKVQLGLFSPLLPDAARLDVTLARIRAVVGEENVGSPVLNDTHHPGDFRMRPFAVSTERGQPLPAGRVLTALRQLRPPEDVTVVFQKERPSALFFRQKRYEVERAYGPWVISGNWWSTDRWSAQEWDLIARPQDGVLLCGCLIRDVVRNRWQMTGLYD
jgi:protein ImuB